MYETLGPIVTFLSCIVGSSVALVCYSDVCQNQSIVSGTNCLLKTFDNEKECVGLQFESINHISPREDGAKVKLSAYVEDFGEPLGKLTAFKLSLSDVNFERLILRYQNLGDENISMCTSVELFSNETHPMPKELYISCPFSNNFYEGTPYHLEYLIIGNSYRYSKKLVFKVPRHEFVSDDTDIKAYTPFVYVDVSDTLLLTLHIQPLPEKFNVTNYKIWLLNNDTNSVTVVNVTSTAAQEQIQQDFIVHDGVHYFIVTALHPDCSTYGCVNATSPYISIKEVTNRLLIMIISVIWIPPVILYALYQAIKLYKKRDVTKRRGSKPNCLLVYSPMHPAHVNVMGELAKYLRCCNINAMIDMFDTPDTLSKNPEQWYEAAFHCANFVIIAASPASSNVSSPAETRHVENLIFRLIKEDYRHGSKMYYVVQFPYCKAGDIPDGARRFKRFSMPEELTALVRTIHGVEYIRFFGITDKEFLDSIKLAELEILDESSSTPKSTDETDDLLPSAEQRRAIEARARDITEGSSTVSRPILITVDELNSITEIGEGEGEGFAFNCSAIVRDTNVNTLHA